VFFVLIRLPFEAGAFKSSGIVPRHARLQ